jgi:zinc protease
MNTKKSVLIFLSFVFFLSVSAVYGEPAEKSCFSTKWPHEKSDLKPDPRLHFGRLENGFRYILMENKEPRDRVGMYLDVQAGSLNETENQRGIAHFLEHMVFNGSTHFKPGELVEYFQSLGMSFGGDTNAHTGYNETVYNIILPNGSKKEVEKGLLVISDYARGALLLPEEIDRERGVILSEKRTRDSATYRTRVAGSAFTLKGTRIPERLPIGIPETLQKADHSVLRDYYDAWYRPENMILMMVGDFDQVSIEPLVKERFAGLKGSGGQPDCPQFGRLEHAKLESFYHYEPEMGSTKLVLETLWDEQKKDDSSTLQIRNLKNQLATTMIMHRLEKLAEDPNTPFTESGYATGEILGNVGYSAIFASTDPEKWQEALKVIEKTLRQALQYGFSEEEFKRAKMEFQAGLDSSLLTAATRNSMALASEIIDNINNNRVFQSPSQEKEIFGPVLTNLSLTEVQEMLVSVWSHQNRLIEVSGNTKIVSDNPETLIKETYMQSSNEPVQAKSASAVMDFPYLKLKETEGKPVAEIQLKGVDAERLVFANEVVLNLKKTDFKKNTIEVRVDFGHGKRGEPVPGLSMLAQAVVNGSGSGSMTESDLGRVLAGSTVSHHFKVQESSFSWEGNALTQDMELLFQVLQTVLVDPGIREDVYRISMDNFKQMYKNLKRDINGGMPLYVEKFLAGGYPHAGLPSWEDFSGLTIAQVRDWLLPAISGSPLEISIVGDFDRSQLALLAVRYFGSLANREIAVKTDAGTISFPAGEQMWIKVDSSIDKAMVVVAWPTADFWDIGRTRRLNILASIFSDRLRKKVREELGAAYSPVVYNASSRVFPGYGLIQAQIIVEPGSIEKIRDVVLSIGDDLRKAGCTEEELERAKAPTLTSLKDMVRTNGYWLNTVLSLSGRYPQQLDWPVTIISDFNAITSREIALLAEKYLVRNHAAIAVGEPEKTEKKEPPVSLPDNP